MNESILARIILQSLWPAEYEIIGEDDIVWLQEETIQKRQSLTDVVVSMEEGENFCLEGALALIYYSLAIIHVAIRLYIVSKGKISKDKLHDCVRENEDFKKLPDVIESVRAKDQIDIIVDRVIQQMARELAVSSLHTTISPSVRISLDQQRLIHFLEGLASGDFIRILLRLPEAAGHISMRAGHFEQVSMLIGYVKSSNGPGLQHLALIMDELFPDKGPFLFAQDTGCEAYDSKEHIKVLKPDRESERS